MCYYNNTLFSGIYTYAIRWARWCSTDNILGQVKWFLLFISSQLTFIKTEKGRWERNVERGFARDLLRDERNHHNWLHGQRKGNRGKLPHDDFVSAHDRIGINFFFTNFTEEWTRESMWKYFLRFGTVIDIFIPSKRSKWGKMFGFMKFKDVSDVEILLNKIRSVAVGADWLFIQEAKFRRDLGDGPYLIVPIGTRTITSSTATQRRL